ncbi:hypothetical protein M885DRAFT_577925 [Pelagophyceae sp. CCMP2097]|nr:hypothetical protein M885DRAFT_577925 [Pelagophyceae sp. CCMP2097]
MASRRKGLLLAFAVVSGNRSTHLLCVYHIWKNFYAHIKPVCVDGVTFQKCARLFWRAAKDTDSSSLQSFEGEWDELVAARKKSMLLALITEPEQHALSVECKSATNAIRTALLAATTAQRGGGETAIMATAREIVTPFGYALMASQFSQLMHYTGRSGKKKRASTAKVAPPRKDALAGAVAGVPAPASPLLDQTGPRSGPTTTSPPKRKKRAAAVNAAPAPKYALPGAVAGLPAPAPPLLVQATAPLEAEDEPVDLAFFDRPPTRIPTWFDELLSTDAPLNAAACANPISLKVPPLFQGQKLLT